MKEKIFILLALVVCGGFVALSFLPRLTSAQAVEPPSGSIPVSLPNCVLGLTLLEAPCVFGGVVVSAPIPCVVSYSADGTAIDESTFLVWVSLFSFPDVAVLAPMMFIQPSQFLYNVVSNAGQFVLGQAVPGGVCLTGSFAHLITHKDLPVTGLPYPEKYFGSSPPGT